MSLRWLMSFKDLERVEEKYIVELGKTIARILFEEENQEIWRTEQREDPSISVILRGKEVGERPPRSEIASGDISARIYCSYWNALILKEGILYKEWKALNLSLVFFRCSSKTSKRNFAGSP